MSASEGVGVFSRGGCLLPGGCVCSGGVSAPGGCLLWGVSASQGERGVSASGGCLLLLLGGGVSQHALKQTPPRGQTHACENITLTQLLAAGKYAFFNKITSKLHLRVH